MQALEREMAESLDDSKSKRGWESQNTIARQPGGGMSSYIDSAITNGSELANLSLAENDGEVDQSQKRDLWTAADGKVFILTTIELQTRFS
jgi:hypothetical protein